MADARPVVGREAELRRLETIIGSARSGVSEVLAVVGEAGSGKTMLLTRLTTMAVGFTLLVVSGMEMEQEFAFAGLAGLLRPLLSRFPDLPAPQRKALDSTIHATGSPPQDRYAAYLGAFGLLTAESARAPVLVIVDDFQWLDDASAEAVLFIARRVHTERIAIVFAAREDDNHTLAGLSTLSLMGIPRADARQVVRTQTSIDLDAGVAESLHALTCGNPLALIEASRLLDADQRSGLAPLPRLVPIGRRLGSSFIQRTATLPITAQRALVVAAASDTDDAAVLADALRRVELSPADLRPGEDADLIRIEEGRLAFLHPLMRSSIYYDAPISERRAAHLALAAASLSGGRADARAWHLVAGSSEPDEAVAAEVESAGEAARSRSAFAIASRAFEAAAHLSPDSETRARRLLESAMDAERAGRVRDAVRLASGARAGTSDSTVRGRARLLEGRAAFWSGTPGAVDVMVEAAHELALSDPARGGSALGEAIVMASFESLDKTRRLAAMPLIDSAPEPHRSIALSMGDLLVGGRESARAVVLGFLSKVSAMDPLTNPWISSQYGRALMLLELWPAARELYGNVVSRARAASALSALPIALTSLAEVDFRTGSWWTAYSLADEAVRIADETGGPRAYCLLALAMVEAGQGREEDCRSHAGEAIAVGGASGNRPLQLWAHWALGMLELGLGKHLQALAEFELRAGIMADGSLVGQPIWDAEWGEALALCGRCDEAAQALASIPAFQLRYSSSLEAATLRVQALLARDQHAESLFARSLERAERHPFERARTELAFGTWLRSHGRDREAIRPLARANATFTALSARGWAEQVRDRMPSPADGITAPVADPTRDILLATLTAREIQVCIAAAGGASNKQIATQLFVSEKTVEFHLGNSFTKLGVRSRVALTRLLLLPTR